MFCAQASGSQLKLTTPFDEEAALGNPTRTGLEADEGMQLTLGEESTSMAEGCLRAKDSCLFINSPMTFFISLASFVISTS
jgi:hypothetical protein